MGSRIEKIRLEEIPIRLGNANVSKNRYNSASQTFKALLNSKVRLKLQDWKKGNDNDVFSDAGIVLCILLILNLFINNAAQLCMAQIPADAGTGIARAVNVETFALRVIRAFQNDVASIINRALNNVLDKL